MINSYLFIILSIKIFTTLIYDRNLGDLMKKGPSLYPKKKSRSNKKILFINGKLLVSGLFLLVLCTLILMNIPYENSPLATGLEVSSSPNYKITIVDNSTGGDVSSNTVLMDNLNQTPVTMEVVEAAKQGTPMIVLGDGSRPRIMLVAGVHGGELPPQLAALNLINELNGEKIKGTVYIIPFAIPINTATGNRTPNNSDPDRVAHNPGTPLNNIINTSIQCDVTLLVDFHSAQPNDIPGKNCIIYYPQNNKSQELAQYIGNRTGSPLVEVGPYPGVLSTVSNQNGITAVVCEVLSPHNKTDPGSLNLSYQYMKAFLDYSGVYKAD
jgi:hypothetical protein